MRVIMRHRWTALAVVFVIANSFFLRFVVGLDAGWVVLTNTIIGMGLGLLAGFADASRELRR